MLPVTPGESCQGVHSVRNVRKRQELGKMSGNCQEKSCFLEKCQDCQEIVSFFPNTKILYLYFMSLKVKDPCCWYVIFVHLAHPEMHFLKIFACGGLFVCLYVKRFAVAGCLTNPENPENPETGICDPKNPGNPENSPSFWAMTLKSFLILEHSGAAKLKIFFNHGESVPK